jgi:5'-nucleotidase
LLPVVRLARRVLASSRNLPPTQGSAMLRRDHPRRRPATLLAAAVVTGAVVLAVPPPAADAGRTGASVDIQLLAINDFHGNLEPPAGSAGTVTTLDPAGNQVRVPAGGVEYLATHLREARKGHRNTVTVGAGDLIGASPLLSAAFHDEPTILAMNQVGLEVTSVGNHEFDEGRAELLRMQRGGCRADDGCYDPQRPFRGAAFPFLAANVLDERTKRPILPPYWIKHFRGEKVGFIGMTLEGTPNIVTAEGVKGLEFTDEVQTANRWVPVLRRQGVKAIVLLLHEGGLPASPVYNYDCNAGGPGRGISGPIVDIARTLDPQIDVVVTGHTHTSYVCDIPDPTGRSRMVTSAASFGKLYTEINLTYDRRQHDIVRSRVAARNVIVSRDVAKAPDLTRLVERYGTLVAPIANRTVGHIGADILGRGAGVPETPLGDLIADAQLEATRPADKGGAQLAFMNPGGVRSDLVFKASGAEGDGVVTYGESFTVQPFTNMLVTMSLTGAQVLTLLQQQFSGVNAAAPILLQPAGVTYTVDRARTGADRVVADSVRVGGQPLDPAATYRITVNEFLAGGGDGFPVLREGTNRLVGQSDLDAFTAYLGAHSTPTSPLVPPVPNRVTFVN